MDKEIWRHVRNTGGLYSVSNRGRIKSNDRTVPTNIRNSKSRLVRGKILKQSSGRNGYSEICLCCSGKKIMKSMHRLVAYEFIDNQNNHPVVNHIDENIKNNDVNNLEWCTHSQNRLHSIERKKMRQEELEK